VFNRRSGHSGTSYPRFTRSKSTSSADERAWRFDLHVNDIRGTLVSASGKDLPEALLCGLTVAASLLRRWAGMHPARSMTLRRWFFTSVLLALALILVVRFTLVPNVANMPSWRLTLASVLDSLTASAVTSLVIGLAYVLLFPAEEASTVEVLPSSREIERAIIRGARDAQHWSVRARTANYFTKVTLQRLADAALSSGGAIIVRMQVLDPENDNLLAAYAKFRSNHPGPECGRFRQASSIPLLL
jgi:hypothetical protein